MIPITERYCTQHRIEKNASHKEYDDYARNQQSKRFYNSNEWAKVRADVLKLDNYIDVYLYMTEGRLVPADMVHHVEELKNNWELRCERNNLISLSSSTHGKLEKMYKKDAKNTRVLLEKILQKYRTMMKCTEMSREDNKIFYM